jgi:hypothetical protein
MLFLEEACLEEACDKGQRGKLRGGRRIFIHSPGRSRFKVVFLFSVGLCRVCVSVWPFLSLRSLRSITMFETFYLPPNGAFSGLKVFRHSVSHGNYFVLKTALPSLCSGETHIHREVARHEETWHQFYRRLFPRSAVLPLVCCSELKVSGILVTRTSVLNIGVSGKPSTVKTPHDVKRHRFDHTMRYFRYFVWLPPLAV